MKFLILVCAFILCSISLFSDKAMDNLDAMILDLEKSPGDFELLENLGIMYHNMSEKQIIDGAKDSIKYFEKAYKIRPNPLTKCWLGSAWTIVSRDTNNPITKLDAVARGIKIIDEANSEVTEEPGIYIVPFIRIQNSYSLPNEFARLDKVNKDLNFLLKSIKNRPEVFEELYDPGEVFLFKGLYLLRENKTRRAYNFWRAGLKIANTDRVKSLLEINMKRIEG